MTNKTLFTIKIYKIYWKKSHKKVIFIFKNKINYYFKNNF